MKKLSVRDLDVRGKRVFVRVDFNVPLVAGTGGMSVTDDRRIAESLPTIQLILEQGGSVIAASHLGRPKGKPVREMSLAPVAKRLGELLERPVTFVRDCVGGDASQAAASLKPGGIVLLENLRFHKGEEANDPEFARSLASLADLYVDDAFGSSHRAHASVDGVPRLMQQAAAGLLMDKEMTALGRLLVDPPRPFAVVVGGAKVSDKLDLLENLVERANTLIIGGAMAYTFLRALGHEMGASLVEPEKEMQARDLMTLCAVKSVSFLLPEDHMEVKVGTTEKGRPTKGPDISPGYMGLDIGAKTIASFSAGIARAGSILWNGPMGKFENRNYAAGTEAIARAIAGSGAFTVVGGGDSAAAVKAFGMEESFSHISTGGGASLEFLSGLTLPGVAALTDAPRA